MVPFGALCKDLVTSKTRIYLKKGVIKMRKIGIVAAIVSLAAVIFAFIWRKKQSRPRW